MTISVENFLAGKGWIRSGPILDVEEWAIGDRSQAGLSYRRALIHGGNETLSEYNLCAGFQGRTEHYQDMAWNTEGKHKPAMNMDIATDDEHRGARLTGLFGCGWRSHRQCAHADRRRRASREIPWPRSAVVGAEQLRKWPWRPWVQATPKRQPNRIGGDVVHGVGPMRPSGRQVRSGF